MNEAKIKEAIISAGEQEPLWLAFNQLLGEHYSMNAVSAIGPDNDPYSRAYNCGRAQAIEDLRVHIANLRKP